jgi:GPH family glycoside/pentoside/hexuronide:cation symporter
VTFFEMLILMLYSTAYSVFSIPYLAMPPEIAPSYDGRTRLMSFRVFFQLAGVTAGSVGAPFLIQLAGGDLAGYQLMGLVLGILATALCLVVFIGAAFLPPGVKAGFVRRRWKVLASRSSTARIQQCAVPPADMVKLFQLAVLATVLACTPYFFGFVLKLDTGQIGTYFLAFTVAGLIALPIMRLLIARYGKRESYIVLIALYAVALASWYLWEAGESQIWFFARAIAIGALNGTYALCAA